MNNDIRTAIQSAGLKQWEVAKAVGCSEGTFTRWLRDKLPEDKKNRILSAIERLREEAQ